MKGAITIDILDIKANKNTKDSLYVLGDNLDEIV